MVAFRTSAAATLRFGIVPRTEPLAGGAYQYSCTLLSVLAELRRHRDDEFVVFADDVSDRLLLGDEDWELRSVAPLAKPAQGLGRRRPGRRHDLRRALSGPLRSFYFRSLLLQGRALRDEAAREALAASGVDVAVYAAPTPTAFEACTPYVMAIHDLQHRIHPEFPETSAHGEFWRREYLFRNAARYATAIVTDSEVGREDVLEYYGDVIAPERVHALPFLATAFPSIDVSDEERRRVRELYDLPGEYLFYPAQFWPHKNHERIVSALHLLLGEKKLHVSVVFVGSGDGSVRAKTLQRLGERARSLGVADQIVTLGYVPAEDMTGLFGAAAALVMPTFFGPTNLPVLEAWATGCPVITSDMRGIREQVADAAVLVDPESAESIAEGIERVWCDRELRRTLVERGRVRLGAYTRDDFRRQLGQILDYAKENVATHPDWGR